MRKRFVVVAVFLVLFAILIYLQYGRDVSVVNSNVSLSGEFYEQRLTIVANKIFITDKKQFAEEMIERTIDNSFRDMMFSYDIAGYPNRIEISVYTNELSRKLFEKNFIVFFESNMDYNYNVKHNPEYVTFHTHASLLNKINWHYAFMHRCQLILFGNLLVASCCIYHKSFYIHFLLLSAANRLCSSHRRYTLNFSGCAE